MSPEVVKTVAIPNSALLCEQLIARYGEVSHHDHAGQQARFEVADVNGDGYNALLVQHGVGATAVYKLYLDNPLDRGSTESVYTIQANNDVTQRVKRHGQLVAGPYQWPDRTTTGMLYDCFDSHMY